MKNKRRQTKYVLIIAFHSFVFQTLTALGHELKFKRHTDIFSIADILS